MQTDYQQSRVYKWENASAWSQKGSKTLETYQIKYLNKRLNRLFGLKTDVHDKYANGVCHYDSYDDAIYLAGYGFNWSVYLHEYAHALTVDSEPPHGKEFVSAFCALLHFVHPDKPSISDLAKSANSYDLDFVSLTQNIWYKKLSRSKIAISKATKPQEKIIEPKKPLNQVHKNYQKLLARQENLLKRQKQYEANLKRVANSLKKVTKSIKQYETKYDEEKLTSKYAEPVVKKIPKSPKQKCLELCEEHNWLKIEKNVLDWDEIEMQIYVWDYKEEVADPDYFAEGSSGEYCCIGWKAAHERALELIKDRRKQYD